MTPTDQALALVVSALQDCCEAWSSGAMPRADFYEHHARALLAKLAPPDAIRAEPSKPAAWILRTGHGDRVALHVPKCEIPEAWKPLYPSPPAHEHGQGWRPIESAPRGDYAVVIFLCDEYGNLWTDVSPGEMWATNGCGFPPTNWMPLPAPPEPARQESEK